MLKAEFNVFPYIKYGDVIVKQGDKVICVTDKGVERGIVADLGFIFNESPVTTHVALLQMNGSNYEYKVIKLDDIEFMALE